MAAHTYSPEQVDRWLHHINHPTPSSSTLRSNGLSLQLLAHLQTLHIARVPFETSALHYSVHRTLSLDPDDLFCKIVEDSRGGYCMELNALFGAMLRGLGFTVLNCGAKVKPGPAPWLGLTHMVNLVTLANTRYLVDVGFGSNEPIHPVPLQHNIEFFNILPAVGRLEFRALASNTDPTQRQWVYSLRSKDGAEWLEQYCFAETEMFPEDYAVMNYYTMTHPTSFFTYTVFAMRGILLNEGKEKDGIEGSTASAAIGGKLVMFGREVRRTMAGKEAEVLETLSGEEDRVAALERYFQVKLRKGEQRAIQGLNSELKQLNMTGI